MESGHKAVNWQTGGIKQENADEPFANNQNHSVFRNKYHPGGYYFVDY